METGTSGSIGFIGSSAVESSREVILPGVLGAILPLTFFSVFLLEHEDF